MGAVRLDEVGYWSEVKLAIVEKYAAAYSTIMVANRPLIKAHIYIDAFAGAGRHVSRATKREIAGSPQNALRIQPPFTELHFIDLDGRRAEELERLAAGDNRVRVHHGDCNEILLKDVFPRCRFKQYRRALCLLDPYGLNVNWEVLSTAGRMESVEIFYNFMIMDANMNVLWRDPAKVEATQVARMNAAWGDHSWREAAYQTTQDLFGPVEQKSTNEIVSAAFRERLKKVAGFAYVPPPMPMRNSKGAVIYYLYFASHKPVAAKIVGEIFEKYRDAGGK